ncbi:hypothetical protein ACKLNR_004278 [Fusarium oxysporum f. sp. zingiberi]
MSSNVTTSESPSTTGPQVHNSQATHAQQVSTTHQNTQVAQAHQSQEGLQHPPAPFELIDHVDELVADIPNQQQNVQNLIADQANMQSSNVFPQQPSNPNFAQHTYGYPSQQAFQYPSHAGQQQYPQMGQRFPSQSAFTSISSSGTPIFLSKTSNRVHNSRLIRTIMLRFKTHETAHQLSISLLRVCPSTSPEVEMPWPCSTLSNSEIPPSRLLQQPQHIRSVMKSVSRTSLKIRMSLNPEALMNVFPNTASSSSKEKMSLHDLIKLYEYVQRKGDVYLPADDAYKLFWSALFKNWNSKMPVSESHPLPARSKSDIHIQVGHYSTDASSNQLANGRRRSKARKGNAVPIYLSLDLDAEGINWLYQDKNGQRVHRSQVKLLMS